MMEEYSERQQHMDNFKKRRDIDAREGEPAMKRLKSPTSDESPRGVSFSKETKVFDGLSPASRLVDSVVWDFFMSQTVNSAGDIVQLFAHISDSCGCLHEVCDLLDDLRQRLDDSGCALVLPGGACVASSAPRAPSPHPRAVSCPAPRHSFLALSLSRARSPPSPLVVACASSSGLSPGGGSGAKLQEVHAPALRELCDISWQAYDDLTGTGSELSGASSECSSPNPSEVDSAVDDDEPAAAAGCDDSLAAAVVN